MTKWNQNLNKVSLSVFILLKNNECQKYFNRFSKKFWYLNLFTYRLVISSRNSNWQSRLRFDIFLHGTTMPDLRRMSQSPKSYQPSIYFGRKYFRFTNIDQSLARSQCRCGQYQNFKIWRDIQSQGGDWIVYSVGYSDDGWRYMGRWELHSGPEKLKKSKWKNTWNQINRFHEIL